MVLPSVAYHPGMWTGDDFFEADFSIANIGVDSKVSSSFDPVQFGKYLDAIDAGISGGDAYRGVITAAHYFFFENPYTGEIVEPSTLRTLASEGVSFSVYFVEQL